MKLYSIVFSPTGGTKKVADILSEAFAYEKEEIDLCNANQDFHYIFDKEDICVIAIPSYGGRVPAIAIERLQQLQGNGCDAILVAVYGNRAYEDTLLELKNTAESVGFRCIGAVGAIAQHSIMHEFASERPDEKDRLELLAYAQQLNEIHQDQHIRALHVPGNQPYKEYHGVPLKPSVDKHCNHCGLCANQCPVQAIDFKDFTQTNHELCISCMRCIAVCPSHARKLNKLLLMGATKALKKACEERKDNEFFLGE